MPDLTKDFIDRNIDIFCSPRSKGPLRRQEETLICRDTGAIFPITDGLPQLFVSNDWDASAEDVTDKIKAFYEETPFPNYDEYDNVASLVEKARQGVFAKLLDDQIPFKARVLECGCGTGQLTNFLSIANRTTVGTDICMNSLRMATEFRDKNGLHRAHFIQMNLFRPCFKEGTFDFVICSGVLHHTSDPFKGFETISRLVKPGGYLIVGLYHKYGRLITDVRREIFRRTKDRFLFLDPRNVRSEFSAGKRRAWFQDQYKNPHESKHTIGEVLGWLKETGLIFVKSIPKTKITDRFDSNEQLFEVDRPGSSIERFLVELSMIPVGGDQGGFFTIIAKKPD